MNKKTPVASRKWKTRLGMLLVAGVAGMVFSSCNTTEGLGQDIQKLGDKIEDKAQEVKAEDNYQY